MSYLLEVCLIGLTLVTSITPSAAAKSVAVPQNSSFAGTWEGSMNGLPGIDLSIQQADRNVRGDIVFYFQERSDPNAPWHVQGESAVPLLSPHLEDKSLTFEIEHHKCHGCSELGPNIKFRMELAGVNEARLWNLAEETGSSSGLKLIRRTEATSTAPQAMQKGISVELPRTSNAVPIPDADHEDSLILTVTHNGSMYSGIDPIAPEVLAEKVRGILFNRPEQKLYLKADARTAYGNVGKVLDAARAAGVEATTLLTAQRQPESRSLVPPTGLEVRIGLPLPSQVESLAVLQVLSSGQQSPALKINNEQISWDALPSKLRQLFQNRTDRVVLVRGDGQLPFGQVVHLVDTCRATGAKVVLLARD